jgi:hypothetical protein
MSGNPYYGRASVKFHTVSDLNDGDRFGQPYGFGWTGGTHVRLQDGWCWGYRKYASGNRGLFQFAIESVIKVPWFPREDDHGAQGGRGRSTGSGTGVVADGEDRR